MGRSDDCLSHEPTSWPWQWEVINEVMRGEWCTLKTCTFWRSHTKKNAKGSLIGLPYILREELACSFAVRTGRVRRHLKGPSGQIRSAWEWYHSICLDKDINRYKFFIFKFLCWIFEKNSKFWAASYKNPSNLLILRQTACIESYWLGTFIWWKKSAKVLR